MCQVPLYGPEHLPSSTSEDTFLDRKDFDVGAADSGENPPGEAIEPPAMKNAIGDVVVIRKDEPGFHFGDSPQTGGKMNRTTVEDGRGKMNIEKVAGEEIPGEQQVVFLAVKAAVSPGMAGKMDHSEASPEREEIAFRKRPADFRGLIAKDLAADGFKPAAPAAGSLVGMGSVDVRLFRGMRMDLGPGQPLDGRQVSGVVEVAVRQQNGLDVTGLKIQAAKQALEQNDFTDQPGIDQDRLSLRVDQEVAEPHHATERMDAGRKREGHSEKL